MIELGDVVSFESDGEVDIPEDLGLRLGDFRWFVYPIDRGRVVPFLAEVVSIESATSVDLRVVGIGPAHTVH